MTNGGNPRLFGLALRAYRERAGMNVRDLAIASGLGASIISRYEHGNRWPTWESVADLCDALQLPRADAATLYLFGGYVPRAVQRDGQMVKRVAAMIAEQMEDVA